MEINGNTLLFAKMRKGATIPTKRDEDAGYDFYACTDEDITIRPGMTVSVPTGIACAIGEGWCLIMKERGSTGIRGMKVSCGVVDSGYRGEIFIALYNGSNREICISNTPRVESSLYYTHPASKAICQGIVLPVPKMDVREVSYDELLSVQSERGTGKKGSTGK